MMKIPNIPKKAFLLLLYPFGLLLFHTTSNIPNFIEKFFSNGVNKIFIQLLSSFTGLFPFSVAEIGLMILVILVPALFIRSIVRIIRKSQPLLRGILNLLTNALIAVILIYFSLVVLWSLNYNRLPFAQIAHLDIRPTAVSELRQLCDQLIDRANTLRVPLKENSQGAMALSGGISKVFSKAGDGYAQEAKIFPVLSGHYGSPKRVLLSKSMSYTGIIGLYCPFTGEANIDTDIPHFSIPSTLCHEMAHQHGFAREDEANYIAWLTCKANPDIDFQYSGTIMGLIHSMNALYRYDPNAYFQLRKKYNAGVNRDFAENKIYWDRHEGPVENVTNSLNNAYLKANRQKDGVYSYGRMVDLLLSEYRKYNSI